MGWLEELTDSIDLVFFNFRFLLKYFLLKRGLMKNLFLFLAVLCASTSVMAANLALEGNWTFKSYACENGGTPDAKIVGQVLSPKNKNEMTLSADGRMTGDIVQDKCTIHSAGTYKADAKTIEFNISDAKAKNCTGFKGKRKAEYAMKNDELWLYTPAGAKPEICGKGIRTIQVHAKNN
jgi:hypothetical protein